MPTKVTKIKSPLIGGMSDSDAAIKHMEPITPREWKLENIDKKKIYVDMSYQRDDINHKGIQGIAKNWDWVGLGCIVVCRRGQQYVVIDGQHRVRAAALRPDVTHLPCIVFEFKDQQEEAAAFMALNTNRVSVSALDKHRAGSAAKLVDDLDVDLLLDESGVQLVRVPTAGYHTKAVSAIKYLIKTIGLDAASSCMKRVSAVDFPEGITGTMIRLLAFFHQHLEDGVSDEMVARMKKVGGQRLHDIERAVSQSYVGGKAAERMRAIAVLDTLNKRCRNPLKFKD